MKNPLLTLFVLLVGVCGLDAADFWESKKFSEWTEKEVRKMLMDSPWARPVSISMGGMGGRSGGMGGGGGRGRRGGGGMGGGGGISAEPSGGDEGSFGGGGRGGGGIDAPQVAPSITVIVRWHGALPIKQAVAKSRFGDEAATSAEALKMIERQEPRYVVGIAGLPAGALRGSPDQLKSAASLKIKGREPIQAENVQAERDQNRANLYLFFPKGEKPITVEDGDVEVAVKLGSLEIKRKFRLKDMMYQGRLEI